MTDSDSNLVADVPQELSQLAHRQLIGYLGLILPALVYVVAGLRPTDGLTDWILLPSVSAYYYTGAIAVFVGVLFALSLFLLTYPGYEGVAADRVVGRVGGAGALGVALFPTAAPAGVSEPSWWSPALRVVHYASVVVLFSAFILFSIWLFRRSSVPKDNRPREKRLRDAVCLLCGIVMIVCMLWAVVSGFSNASIFLPEAIAIVAFAVSWLVKGEAYQPVLSALRSLSAG